MLKLCGFSNSNYYNKVKFALLEKGVEFTEELTKVGPWAVPGLTDRTPFGKVPFIETLEGTLCESEAILAYLEQRFPTPALIPQDPWLAAKMREFVVCLELHLELVAREHIPTAYFGAPPMSDSGKARVHKKLEKNIEGFMRLIKSTPLAGGRADFLFGGAISQADCAAFVHLPLIALTCKIIYGEDMLLAAGLDWKPYVKFMGQRPAAQRVDEDRKAYTVSLQNATKA
jgi:glutathione S-transferase